jgi:hypothetical protein
MSEIYHIVSNMHIKFQQPPLIIEPKVELVIKKNSEKIVQENGEKKSSVQSNKNTEKDSVSLSIEARKSYQESLEETEENLPVSAKLLKAQLARLQQRLVDIKQEINQIKENDNLDKEEKNSMLIAKQDQITNIMSAIQTASAGLLEAMKPPS